MTKIEGKNCGKYFEEKIVEKIAEKISTIKIKIGDCELIKNYKYFNEILKIILS